MQPQSIPALAALFFAASAQAFKTTSPFFLLSTQPLDASILSSAQIATAGKVHEQTIQALSSCDAAFYVVVSQPGLSATDLQDGKAMPRMRKRALHSSTMYDSSLQISEIVGELDAQKIVEDLQERCNIDWRVEEGTYDLAAAKSMSQAVMKVQLPALHPGEQARKDGLEAADARIEAILAPIANNTKHVLIYTSSPPTSAHYAAEADEAIAYQMDEPAGAAAMHLDLKREMEAQPYGSRNSTEHQKGLPLFERYQFLSPGIFMGLSVSLLLFIILYVGISAIAGLEVSYGAFSKEMGPAAQSKNKQ